MELLNGSNYKNWRRSIDYHLTMNHQMDLCLADEVPAELTEDSDAATRKAYKEWYASNRKAKTFIRTTIIDSVRGSIEEPELAWDYLEAISEYYMENDKTEISKLSIQFSDMTFSGVGSVREHIMGFMDINARLRDLNMGVKDDQVVAQALESLPATFSNLKTSYNASEAKWNLNKLISVCVNEEERIKKESRPTTAINLVEKPKWKKQNKLKAKKTVSTKVSGKTGKSEAKDCKVFKFKCFFCKKAGHMKKDCPGFKTWMIKKGFNKEEGANKE